MNFLAHDAVLPLQSPSLTRVGAALPDLWALLTRRPLAMSKVRELREATRDADAAALVVGVTSHLHADAVFHRHPEFARRVQWVATRMSGMEPGLRHAQLAAHVMVEMLLDRHLLVRDASLVTRYYAAFTTDNVRIAARLGTHDVDSCRELEQILERFVSSRFLAEYGHSSGLVTRFFRSLSRAVSVTDCSSLVRQIEASVDAWSEELSDGSEALLGDVRVSLRRSHGYDGCSPLL